MMATAGSIFCLQGGSIAARSSLLGTSLPQHAYSLFVAPSLVAAVSTTKSSLQSRRTQLSSKARENWFRYPVIARYFLSGNIGNIFLFGCEKLSSSLLGHWIIASEVWRDTASFFLAYWLHIPILHLLHASLVYGWQTINTPEKYRTTLASLGAGLTVTAVLSTLLNWVCMMMFRMSKSTAFVATLAIMSIINYVITSLVMK